MSNTDIKVTGTPIGVVGLSITIEKDTLIQLACVLAVPVILWGLLAYANKKL